MADLDGTFEVGERVESKALTESRFSPFIKSTPIVVDLLSPARILPWIGGPGAFARSIPELIWET